MTRSASENSLSVGDRPRSLLGCPLKLAGADFGTYLGGVDSRSELDEAILPFGLLRWRSAPGLSLLLHGFPWVHGFRFAGAGALSLRHCGGVRSRCIRCSIRSNMDVVLMNSAAGPMLPDLVLQ